MNLDRGEIVLIDVQFHQQPGSKIRPAVVVLDTGDGDFVAVPITSRQRTGAFEVSIEQWREAGLNTASIMRVHKIAVLPKLAVRRRLGRLSANDSGAFRSAISHTYCSQASPTGPTTL